MAYRRRGIRKTGRKSILCATMFCIGKKKSRTIFKSNRSLKILFPDNNVRFKFVTLPNYVITL
jgi:hypothetical protein